MKLYHGTDARLLSRILHKGIIPRGPKKGNWQHTVTSNDKAVYLTDAYALFFSFCAVRGVKGAAWAVLEVDTDKLKPMLLMPDEDFLEQVGRLQKDKDEPDAPKELQGDMKARTLWYRANLWRWMGATQVWQQSLKHLGTCQYLGPVPASAITRAVVIPAEKNIHMEFVVDPFISLMNYRICQDKYRIINAKLFGDEPDPAWHYEFTHFRCADIKLLTIESGKIVGERVFTHDDQHMAPSWDQLVRSAELPPPSASE